jgi:Uma2 family endonuclease
MSMPELDLSAPCTEAEYLAMGETTSRIELIDGALWVTPPANIAHDQMAVEIRNALRQPAEARGLRVLTTPGLRLMRDRIVVPDVAIGHFPRQAKTVEAADAVLVVEVTSPSNAATDRGQKKAFYAAARIEWYLLVEPDYADYQSVELHLHRLAGDRYVPHAVAKQGDSVVLDALGSVPLNTTDVVDF